MGSSPDPYRLWEVIGVWAGAAATFAAVVVSLWLGLRSDRVWLRISVGKRVVVDLGGKQQPDIVLIAITNLGIRPVRITAIGWYYRLWGGIGLYQTPPGIGDRSHGLPATLEHGQTLQWTLPYDKAVNGIAELLVARSGWWRLKLPFLRLTVGTTLGKSLSGLIEDAMRKDIAARTKELRAAARSSRND